MKAYIQITNLTKQINKIKVLDNININLEKGKIYGVTDDNNLSKNVLIRLICAMLVPTTGEISIDSQILYKDIEYPPSIGIITESPGFLPYYTAKQNLQMIAQIDQKVAKKEIYKALNAVGLSAIDETMYNQYTKAMKQKLSIAQIIMKNPDLILIDEYKEISNSDIKKILNKQKQQGKTIIIASNERESLQRICDKVYIIKQGKLG